MVPSSRRITTAITLTVIAVAVGRFSTCSAAKARAEDDARLGVRLLHEADVVVPAEVVVGSGHSLATRIDQWVWANVPGGLAAPGCKEEEEVVEVTKEILIIAGSQYGTRTARYSLQDGGKLVLEDEDEHNNLVMNDEVAEFAGLTLEEARERVEQINWNVQQETAEHRDGCHLCNWDIRLHEVTP